MGQDHGTAGQELADDQERTPEQVREEIEQTRTELGDTVAALSAKTDVKGQAKHAVSEAKATVTGTGSRAFSGTQRAGRTPTRPRRRSDRPLTRHPSGVLVGPGAPRPRPANPRGPRVCDPGSYVRSQFTG
jgi:hypothetical protein